MARMLKAAGHEVVLYGAAGSTAPCDEFVEITSRSALQTQYRESDPSAIKWNSSQKIDEPVWLEHQSRGRNELAARYRKGDIALISFGFYQRFIPEVAALAVEFICGYSGIFHDLKVFPSQAWMHYLYGEMKRCKTPGWYDVVIPHYLDLKDFLYSDQKQDYLLFLGRILPAKGVDIAADVAAAAGIKLVVAGQSGDSKGLPAWLSKYTNIEFVGAVDAAQRGRLLAGARALLAPTRYLEAFGMTVIEAGACGTPVITTDWGAFTETVDDGVTGFRCRTFEEFVIATEKAKGISPAACRDRIRDRYSLEAIWPRYSRHFERLAALGTPEGWYHRKAVV
jgi:glycosyltransferase involved in cell wall biosynthesis